jgi:hypothetical protein
MAPMKPTRALSGIERWWPDELGDPSARGSQIGVRYAFFQETHRLLIERNGKLSVYDTGDCQIWGMQQAGAVPTFTSQNGALRLNKLKKVSL